MNQRNKYLPIVLKLEQQYHIPRGLLAAQIEHESGWRPDARSNAGAYGLGQLMPRTAASLGVDPTDPMQNLRGAAMYMARQLKAFGGNPSLALAAYNAGPAAAHRALDSYPETKAYVQRVLSTQKRYGGAASAAIPTQQQAVTGGIDSARIAKIQNAWSDSPTNGALRVEKEYEKAAAAPTQQQGFSSPYDASSATKPRGGWYKTPNGFVQAQRPGEAGWQFLQRLGTRGFGLENDPGNSQTYGGSHEDGSLHYQHNAIDFGDGRNTRAQLQQWYNWLNARREPLGIQELIWQAPGHYNHVHTGIGS